MRSGWDSRPVLFGALVAAICWGAACNCGKIAPGGGDGGPDAATGDAGPGGQDSGGRDSGSGGTDSGRGDGDGGGRDGGGGPDGGFSDAGAKCAPGNCTGCCNASGCQPGNTDTDCGTGGVTCAACGTGTCNGGQCSSCNPTNCQSGCCATGVCNSPPTLDHCGINGQACLACDPNTADGCNGGTCTCGGGPACGPGLACLNSTCVCDQTTCPGCCDQFAVQCLPGDAGTACGTGGTMCQSCPPGSTCSQGFCVATPCDRSTCPTGCCGTGFCNAPPSATQCGIAGAACADCTALIGPNGESLADGCGPGGDCECGPDGGLCPPGKECVNGACQCTANACPAGCCDLLTDQCLDESRQSASACGLPGTTCKPCVGALKCSGGACGTCNPLTCQQGCCVGTTCVNANDTTDCGQGGAACVACDPASADTCSAQGTCTCGAQPACAAGERCVGGQCLCDPQSCTGCCAPAVVGNTSACRPGNSTLECGRYGAACAVCTPRQTCVDGTCG